MKTHYDCVPCMLNGIINLYNKNLIEEKYRDQIYKEVLTFYSKLNFSKSPLLTNRDLHRLIRKIAKNSDPYKPLKEVSNKEALKFYEIYKDKIINSKNPLEKALRLAIAGNIIDFGPAHSFDIEQTINRVMNSDFAINDSHELFEDLKNAKSILYLADNAGEIVFDKLFLEIIGRNDITFVVRNSPILNDATMEEVKLLGIDKIARVITNGDNAPGTLLEHVSEEFLEAYNNADLIISKGQGNYEGLCEVKDKNIYFLLMIKCHLIAQSLGINKGDYIAKSTLKNNTKIKK